MPGMHGTSVVPSLPAKWLYSQGTAALAEPAASALGRRMAALEASLALVTSDAAGAAAVAAGAVQRVATAEWRIEKARRGPWPVRDAATCSKQLLHPQTFTGQAVAVSSNYYVM